LQPDTLLGPLHLFLSLDSHNLATILEARKVIEGALLAFVAKTIDDSVIAQLKANLAEFERAVERSRENELDPVRLNELAQEFRGIIESAVDNPILARAVKSLDVLSAAGRSRITTSGSLKRLLENHRRMVEALVHHDSIAAQQALEAHIDYMSEICDVTLRDAGA
jgi:DNA-binding FadR family transcriptional regulator